MSRFKHAAVAAAILPVLALAACGGGEELDDDGDNGGGGAEKGEITMSGQNFPEMLIMGEMYKAVLENAGYTVDFKPVGDRKLYIEQIGSGSIDLAPEYLSSVTDALNVVANGADAESPATSDVDETLQALTELAAAQGATPLEPAQATDQNAFFVTKEFSDENQVTTLTQLGELGEPIVLAANSDCPEREDCELGLENTYGLNITEVLPLGFQTTETKDAVTEGEADLGQTGTTDGSLEELGFVLLEDDKGLQHAENLVPLVNTEFLDANPDVADLLNELSATLTTEDLAALNQDVAVNRTEPADAAVQYLEGKELL